MTRWGVTGASGFIGRHLRYYLHGRPGEEVLAAGREEFADPRRLAEFARGCQVIVHLAGRNRGNDREVARTNIDLARSLIEACRSTGAAPLVIFASSTHIHKNTPYGASKRACAEEFRRWAAGSGGSFANLVLPHVFGEGQRPFYNSVVATFCRRLADGGELRVDPGGRLELIHAQQVAALIGEVAAGGVGGEFVPSGVPLSVEELARRLGGIDRSYREHIIPALEDELERNLFNTYRSYLFPGYFPVPVPVREDHRGFLFETVKSRGGGQGFFSLTRPGITRGDHYHARKMERFLVLRGEAEIRVREIFSDRVETFPVDGISPRYVDIPTFHTHTITNTGRDDLLTLFWTTELFNPEDPDTFAEKVNR